MSNLRSHARQSALFFAQRQTDEGPFDLLFYSIRYICNIKSTTYNKIEWFSIEDFHWYWVGLVRLFWFHNLLRFRACFH